MVKQTIFVLFAVFALIVAQKVEDDLNLNTDEKSQVGQVEARCLTETKAKLDDVQKFDKGVFGDSKELRCFYKCLLTNFGVMDEQGRIVKNKINLLVPDNLRKKAEHCFDREKGEPCDVAYETYKCYIKSVYL